MNSSQIEIIKQTVPVLQEHGETLTRRFYENMFHNNPEVRDFFNPAHQQAGTQQRALAGAICAYAANIDNLSALSGAVDLIAHKHVSLGIKPEHYPIVGQNLILTIQEVLGEAANEAIIEAWTVAYQELARIFVGQEAQLYQAQQKRYGWNGPKPFTITQKVAESGNITSFYLQPLDGNLPVGQQAGQYTTVHLTVNGQTVMRNYSLSNAPDAGAYRISVKRETAIDEQAPDGLVSNYLHDYYHEGDVLELAPPCGEFQLHIQEDNNQPIVFVAGGVGITPIIAMLHDVLKRQSESGRPIYLFQCVRNTDVLPFASELQALLERHDNLHWHIFLSQQKAPVADGLKHVHHGRLSMQALDSVIDRQQAISMYACGPAGLISHLSTMIDTRDQAQDSFRYEFFGPAQAV